MKYRFFITISLSPLTRAQAPWYNSISIGRTIVNNLTIPICMKVGMADNFIKKIMLISLFVIPFCKAAADEPISSWDRAVQPYQPINNRRALYLENNRIEVI